MTKTLYLEQLPDEIYIEEKSSGTQLCQSLEAETGLPIERIKPQESKWERARVVSPIQKAQRCYLPEDEEWVYDFIEEHANFPGRLTDQVDTTAHALRILREISEDSDFSIDTVRGGDSNRWRNEGKRATPDKASFDWVATQSPPSKWRRFSGAAVDEVSGMEEY